MKKLILLLFLTLTFFTLCAQKLETVPLDDSGDSYEVRIKHFNKLYGETFAPETMAPLLKESDKVALRTEWRNRCAEKLITPQLKLLLQQIAQLTGGGLWVTFYADASGKILTVKFAMSATVKVKLPSALLKELYNTAMTLSLTPSAYGFDSSRIYALDGFDLMKRAVEEELK